MPDAVVEGGQGNERVRMLANRRILVIDDAPTIHEDFYRILSGSDATESINSAEKALFGEVVEPATASFKVDFAHQGREGVAKVRASVIVENPYAMAFVAMRMPPGWDGIQTIRAMWKVDSRLQIVICAAHSDLSWNEMLGKLDVEDRLFILKKPFDRIEVTQLASVLTTKWDLARQAEMKVARLEASLTESAHELEIANRELDRLIHEVSQIAMHDALTGLPNRLLFADRAMQALGVARREGTHPVVLMLDLDRFKEVNDTLGHHQGDNLLKQVAQRLTGMLRPSDTVARFGGDEFALLLTSGGLESATTVATRIGQVLEAPFTLDDSTVGIEVSVGISIAASKVPPTVEEMLRQADIAMYKAKADRSGFAHFAACNDDGTRNRLTMIGELRQALDGGELVMYYQPKIAIPTGELVGVEALVRWQHPTRGLLLPAEFIALAEGSTLIKSLTSFVFESSLRSCRRWLDRGVRLPVAVNVSARSLCEPEFSTAISDFLTRANVPAELLTIEITEGAMMAYPILALGILHELREVGVHLSVDDYGTGYSSLAYLKDLPVNELKIDRVFVKGLTSDPKGAIIVESATDLGHALGLLVVAEGVEDEPTLAALKALGVDVAQGYHLGRPMPENLLEPWIATLTTGEPKMQIPSPRVSRSDCRAEGESPIVAPFGR